MTGRSVKTTSKTVVSPITCAARPDFRTISARPSRRARPVRWSLAYAPGFRSSASVASPATAAIGLPFSVPTCATKSGVPSRRGSKARMIALELHDLVAPAEGARRAEREERRLGAGRREAYLLGARHGPAELVGQRDDGLVHEEVGGAVLERVPHRGDDRGMSVAQDQRARAHEIVDVLTPAHVVQLGSRAAPDDEREIVREPRRPEDAAGQRAGRGLEHAPLFVGSRTVHGLPPGAITRPLVAPAYRLPRACASPMARSAEVLERRARATYTGATREPEGGMRELVFALEFRGSAGPVPGVDGRRR